MRSWRFSFNVSFHAVAGKPLPGSFHYPLGTNKAEIFRPRFQKRLLIFRAETE
jgi:hypothetical protein